MARLFTPNGPTDKDDVVNLFAYDLIKKYTNLLTPAQEYKKNPEIFFFKVSQYRKCTHIRKHFINEKLINTYFSRYFFSL